MESLGLVHSRELSHVLPTISQWEHTGGAVTRPKLCVADISDGSLPLPEDDDALPKGERELRVRVSHVGTRLYTTDLRGSLPTLLRQRSVPRMTEIATPGWPGTLLNPLLEFLKSINVNLVRGGAVFTGKVNLG